MEILEPRLGESSAEVYIRLALGLSTLLATSNPRPMIRVCYENARTGRPTVN